MKQWLKRAFATVCSSIMACTALTGLVACKPDDDSSSSSSPTACTHQWDGGVEQVAPTCESDGSALFTCTVCGETETRVLEGGHIYEETVVPVSCVRNGSTTRTCERCGDSEKKITAAALGHKLEGAVWTKGEDVRVSDCIYQHVETATCSECQETVTHTEDFSKHSWVVSISEYATCSQAGEKLYECEDCDETMTVEYNDVNAHAWVEQSIVDNVITYVCSHNSAHTKTVFSAKTEVAATVPAAALQEAGEVELQNAAIKMDEDVLSQLDGKDVNISVAAVDNTGDLGLSPEDLEKLGNNPVYNFEMTAGEDAVTSFDGSLTVTVPYNLGDGEDPDNIAIWYIDDDGNTTTIQATYSYNASENQGYATFTTNHFSYYTVVRLSPEERCGIYGHDNEVKVIPASCNVQGYTLTECKVCHELTRDNFTAALTHNHETTVTAATCTEKGYTTYACAQCGDKYITDYTPMITHTYEEKVTAATCIAGGYTLYTCTVCHQSYVGNETAATAHNFVDGACSACGRKDPNATVANFYLNMIESLATANTYYLEVEDLHVVTKEDKYGSDVYVHSLRAVVGFDEKGLVGKGEVKMSQVDKRNNEVVDDIDGTATVVFRDGKMYLVEETSGTYSDEMIGVMDQSMMFGGEQGAAMMGQMSAMLEANAEYIETLLSGITAVENSPLDKVFKTVIEYVFTRQDTQDGYKFTLNKDRAKDMYVALQNSTAAETFDLIFGEGAFEAVVTYLKSSLTKTVAEFEADATTELAKWGVQKDVLYALVENMSGGEMNIGEMLTEVGEMQVYAFINAMTEMEMAATDYEGMIDEYAGMFDQVSVFEMVAGMMDSMGGNVSGGGSSDGQMKPMAVTSAGSDSASASDMIDELLEKLSGLTVTFDTDKAGTLLSVNANINDLAMETGEESSFSMDGKISFIPNGSYAAEYENIIKEAQQFEAAFDLTNPIETELYTLFEMGGEMYLWSNGHYEANANNLYIYLYPTQFGASETLGEEEYNGETCTKKKVLVNSLYKVESQMIMMEKDCHGWWRAVDFDANRTPTTYVYTWTNAAGDIVGMEWVEDQSWQNHGGNAEIYYNPVTKEYASETQHSYSLVATVQPNGCEYGRYIYECSVCGEEYYKEFGEGHKVASKAELVAGATNCEQGVTVTEYCTKCNKTLEVRTIYQHAIYEKETLVGTSAECGDIYFVMHTCPCGQEMWEGEWRTDCKFDHVETVWCRDGDLCSTACNTTPGHEHYIDTWRCAINACAFTYTREFKLTYVRENGVCYAVREYLYTFDGGKTYAYTDKQEEHNTEYAWTTDPTTGVQTEVHTCRLCNQVVRIYKWDRYDRNIYEERPLEDYKWEKVYTGCDYVETYYRNGEAVDSYSGTQHDWEGKGNYRDNCTQYFLEGQQCEVCGEVNGQWYAPDSWYWDDHGHNWNYDESTQLYTCDDCGTQSETGADGLISLEDMASDSELKVGYFNYKEFDMDSEVTIEIVMDYQADGSGVKLTGDLFTKEITSPADGYTPEGYYQEYREAGIVTVNLDAVRAALEAQSLEAETISVVFLVFDESQMGGDGSYLAHAVTFDWSVYAA